MLYPDKMRKIYKDIENTCGKIRKLSDKPKVTDSAWINKFRRLGNDLRDHSQAGLELEVPSFFDNLAHESNEVLNHFVKAAEGIMYACDAMEKKSLSLPVLPRQDTTRETVSLLVCL